MPENGSLNYNDTQLLYRVLLRIGTAKLGRASMRQARDVVPILAEQLQNCTLNIQYHLKESDTHKQSVGGGNRCERKGLKYLLAWTKSGVPLIVQWNKFSWIKSSSTLQKGAETIDLMKVNIFYLTVGYTYSMSLAIKPHRMFQNHKTDVKRK